MRSIKRTRVISLSKNKLFLYLFLLFSCLASGDLVCRAQIPTAQFTANQPPANYLKNSAAFRQEIMRMQITVARAGKLPMSITDVPRVEKDDVIKVRLLDEPVGGIKPDQSYWDWTFLVAFVNPSRNIKEGQEKQKSVSEEIQFRKSGWYKEYSFVVPYDSQPVFFLYPKPKYRSKILKLINKKYAEVQKLGDKTIEIAGAYAQIDSFLNELQGVLVQTQMSRYGSFVTYPDSIANGGYYNGNNNQLSSPVYNYNALVGQAVERLAQSFNIRLPSCWQTTNGNLYSGNYNLYSNQTSFGYAVTQDLIGRAQCVAKNVRIEDFDFSISRMLKEGGIFAATQLRDKYPQIAYWINIAAAALDFIVKVFQKSPLQIVPTIVSTAAMPINNNVPSNPALQNNQVKISLFAESQPTDQGFVSAYPVVVQKWQSDADPEIIELASPVLLESCLRAGTNILKNASLKEDPVADTFTKDFKFVVSSSNNFKREFSLKKNIGMGGWELNLSPDDINQISKINTDLEMEISGTRGFNEIKSPKFLLPISSAGGNGWQIKAESQKTFAVGGKRKVTLQNPVGGCRCLQSITFKPASGASFVFDANSKGGALEFSSDNKEVSFEIDATGFQPGQGQIELRTYGNQSPITLLVKLYPLPPGITDFKMAKGDNQAIVTGERLEQIQYIKINGKRAKTLPNQNQINNQINNQKTFVFEDANARQTDGTVLLEIGLEDDRSYQYPKTFTASPARPLIAANEAGEIEGTVISSNSAIKDKAGSAQLDLSKYPVIPVDAAGLSVTVQNKLTDYDFKQENLSVETRIEKSQSGDANSPKAAFEVLDSNTLKINFTLNEQIRKFLGGRRLQFRIRDKERGDSDWYTIKQTFVRVPQIESVKCTGEMNGQCKLTGQGIDYISQVSVDGGKNWFPENNASLQTQPSADGKTQALIPLLTDKNLLQIKLRDFPKTVGMQIRNFSF